MFTLLQWSITEPTISLRCAYTWAYATILEKCMLAIVYHYSRKWLQVVESVGADGSTQREDIGLEGNRAKDGSFGSMQI